MSREFRTWYLWFQGAAVGLWWIALVAFPPVREIFSPDSAPPAYLWAFLPGDLLLVAAGSARSAHTWTVGSPPAAFWICAGALWFGTSYVVALTASGELPWAAAALMLGASVGTAAASRAR